MFQISQLSKCPKVVVISSFWEALGEVSKLIYKSLLYFSSNGSYCSYLIPRGTSGDGILMYQDDKYEKIKFWSMLHWQYKWWVLTLQSGVAGTLRAPISTFSINFQRLALLLYQLKCRNENAKCHFKKGQFSWHMYMTEYNLSYLGKSN